MVFDELPTRRHSLMYFSSRLFLSLLLVCSHDCILLLPFLSCKLLLVAVSGEGGYTSDPLLDPFADRLAGCFCALAVAEPIAD